MGHAAVIVRNAVQIKDTTTAACRISIPIQAPRQAQVQDDEVHITCADGKVRVYGLDGRLRRIL